MEIQNIKIGKMYQTSWGYDQTNYDFIVVDKVSPSGKTVTCRRCSCQRQEVESQQDGLKPIPQPYGLPFRMSVRKWDYSGKETNYLRGNYPFLSRFENEWDNEQKENWFNSKRMGSFNQVEEGKLYWQTNSQFGH